MVKTKGKSFVTKKKPAGLRAVKKPSLIAGKYPSGYNTGRMTGNNQSRQEQNQLAWDKYHKQMKRYNKYQSKLRALRK